MNIPLVRTHRLAALFLLALTMVALPPAGAARAQCAGTTTDVTCTGIDPDGYDTSVEAPGASTTVTVQTGAQVDDHIFMDGNDTTLVQAGGAITSPRTTQAVGIAGVGPDNSVINGGSITAITKDHAESAVGIELMGDSPQVNNAGSITAIAHGDLATVSYGITVQTLGVGAQVSNSGTITSSAPIGEAAIGISAAGDGIQITNSGTITSDTPGGANGITVNGSGTQVTNSGTITISGGRSGSGIMVLGPVVRVTNSGTITATGTDSVGIGIDFYTGQITNSGTISGGTASIWQPNGDSALAVTNSGTLNGDVLLNDGDDTFTAEGGAVNGTIDGGANFDSLIFAFDVLDVDYPALAAQIAAASPAGGSLAYGGATYTWINFEQLVNLLNIVASGGGGEVVVTVGGIADGRLNRYDLAATTVVYPLAAGGVELYTPRGEWAFNAGADAIRAALAQAASSGAAVEIAARLEIALYAMPDGSLFATGPGYTFAFQPFQCGIDG